MGQTGETGAFFEPPLEGGFGVDEAACAKGRWVLGNEWRRALARRLQTAVVTIVRFYLSALVR